MTGRVNIWAMINGFQISVTTYYIHHPVKSYRTYLLSIEFFSINREVKFSTKEALHINWQKERNTLLNNCKHGHSEEKYEVTFEGFIWFPWWKAQVLRNRAPIKTSYLQYFIQFWIELVFDQHGRLHSSEKEEVLHQPIALHRSTAYFHPEHSAPPKAPKMEHHLSGHNTS